MQKILFIILVLTGCSHHSSPPTPLSHSASEFGHPAPTQPTVEPQAPTAVAPAPAVNTCAGQQINSQSPSFRNVACFLPQGSELRLARSHNFEMRVVQTTVR